VEGFSSGGYIYPAYNAAGVPLLDSFYFRYTDTDHHLTSLAALPQADGKIMLALADQDNGDPYYYSVEHKRRAESGIITGSFVDFCTSHCVHPLTPPTPPHAGISYVFALRGFRFYFRDGDHHIDQIAIVREPNGVHTYFNDKDDNDSYVVYVDYAWLPSSMVEATGSLTGTVNGVGVRHSLTAANRAVITGFKVDYVETDREIYDFGILTRTSDVEVYYGDSSGSGDDFAYQVNYAILTAPPVICCASGAVSEPAEDGGA
jgi:hypothetical protein